MKHVIGVDIGGTHAAAAWVDLNSGKLLASTLRRRDVDKHGSAHQILSAWTHLLKEVRSLRPELVLAGVGLAMPGPCDYEQGICKIRGVGKYDSLFGLDLKATLRSYLHNSNLPIHTLNDAEAFLLGAVKQEGWEGQKVIGLTLGTGLGSAFYDGEKIVQQGEGVPPKGHLYAVPFQQGIAETYLSTSWFEQSYYERSGGEVRGVKALAEIASKDPVAAGLFQAFGRHLAQLLRPYLQTFRPGQLLLGGNVMHSYGLFKDTLLEGLQEAGFYREPVLSTATESLAIQGAAHGLPGTGPPFLQRKDSGQPPLPLQKPLSPEGYDLFPSFPLLDGSIGEGYQNLLSHWEGHEVLTLEGYLGVDWERVKQGCNREFEKQKKTVLWYAAAAAFRSEGDIDHLLVPYLGGEDPVFGKRYPGNLQDFFETDALNKIQPDPEALSLIYGPGAALAGWQGALAYFDLPKNELQYRSRAGGLCNLGASKPLSPKVQYKRMYFADWVVLNRHKEALLPRIDYLCDAQHVDTVTWMQGKAFRHALSALGRHAFRARPWFEPGAWGGQWIKKQVQGLSPDAVNYAWSFELIVPENGLVLEREGRMLEFSFDFLMYHDAAALLGAAARRFGTEFPIRFDFLDTFGGGNLSVQCHPRPEYMRQHFGESFTQDETYYILDAAADATVYLGFQEDIEPAEFKSKLEHSQQSATPLSIPDYVQVHPAQKHDLFLIPSGTIHCSGINNLVLEISSTPYIFTFKLYDWLRLDLDGNPRPINIERGFANLQFDRKGEKVKKELISKPHLIASGPDWQVFHLPTHAEHFYDVHRLEFEQEIEVNTAGSVHILNLVEGSSIEVRTGDRSMTLHYAETFVVPAAAEHYTLRNRGSGPAKVVKAFIKPEAI